MANLWNQKLAEVDRNSGLNEDISTNENVYLNPRSLDKVEVNDLHMANAINDQNTIEIKNSRTNVNAGSKFSRGGTGMKDTGVSIATTSNQV